MEKQGVLSSIYNYGWKPTNKELLKKSEEDLLRLLREPYTIEKIKVQNFKVNTLKMGLPENPPLILLHGFGSGIGQWVRNFDELSRKYRIYACDLIGFGRSSRPPFGGNSVEEAEAYFIEVLHGWLEALQTGPYTLCAHSMGSYLASVYLLNYGNHNCKKLILADPWGVPKQEEEFKPRSWKVSFAMTLANNFSPLTILRAAGPYGPSLFTSIRSDLVGKFKDLEDPSVFAHYLYHVNAQIPAGEDAFANLQQSFAWAREPLIHRLPAISKNISVFFVYGDDTWMDKVAGWNLTNEMKGTNHDVHYFVIPNAGHHVMLDNYNYFNSVIIDILDKF
eukprot:TRINITY_DN6099_c0_g1_i13.p1 TRINITY_DN6099_c0_g1~~TRINITY_DN6099_c0_g1_i13.p1  ORF type:complete len:335 (-),score=58.55 TRINITY_DN6099_c0_g1_i13:187-1191(-)